MSSEFVNNKLNRVIWIAMLNEQDIAEAVNSYLLYIKELQNINTLEAKKEIKFCQNLFVEKLTKYADKYMKDKNYNKAVICYNYMYQYADYNIDILKSYIKCVEKIEQYDLQLDLAKVLVKKDKTGDSYKYLSSAYDNNKDYKKAIQYYYKYIDINKKEKLEASDYNLIGCSYFNSYVRAGEHPNDAEKALEFFNNALSFQPTSKVYLKNTIVAAMKAKNYEIEKKCWDTYIQQNYASKEDEFTYCASCMRNGDIKTWAKYYKSRFYKNEPTIYPKMTKPEWTGKEDLSNSTLLVHYEQGYGDNIMMFGYMPRLITKAKKVLYYVQNNLYELFKDNEYGVEIYCQKHNDLSKLEFDYHIPSMSLPIALDLDESNISVGSGFIKAKEVTINKYKQEYFNNDKLKIGISFQGVSSNNKRDIPIDVLLKLDKLDNVQLYCLTKDVDDKLLNKFKRNKVINIAQKFNDFADTAAAIQNTDLVLSSDNCILNLAGALGKKTLGMFNYHYEFRWYNLSGENCGWYTSVLPIVNNANNDWNLSMDKAIEYIKTMF